MAYVSLHCLTALKTDRQWIKQNICTVWKKKFQVTLKNNNKQEDKKTQWTPLQNVLILSLIPLVWVILRPFISVYALLCKSIKLFKRIKPLHREYRSDNLWIIRLRISPRQHFYNWGRDVRHFPITGTGCLYDPHCYSLVMDVCAVFMRVKSCKIHIVSCSSLRIFSNSS